MWGTLSWSLVLPTALGCLSLEWLSPVLLIQRRVRDPSLGLLRPNRNQSHKGMFSLQEVSSFMKQLAVLESRRVISSKGGQGEIDAYSHMTNCSWGSQQDSEWALLNTEAWALQQIQGFSPQLAWDLAFSEPPWLWVGQEAMACLSSPQ